MCGAACGAAVKVMQWSEGQGNALPVQLHTGVMDPGKGYVTMFGQRLGRGNFYLWKSVVVLVSKVSNQHLESPL